MLFTSPVFLFLFLPLLLLVYYLSPHRIRNTVLLVSSLLFYMWGEVFFVIVMMASIAMNHIFGRFLGRDIARINKRRILFAAIAANLILLCVFKYANFVVNNINFLLLTFSNKPIVIHDIHLPLGISFFTFQAMSYIIDVYRNEVSAQKNIFNVALYISLFPQLIAGPIVRYTDIASQIKSRAGNLSRFVSGIRRFVFGLSKKVILANYVGEIADRVFALHVSDLNLPVAWLGITCYALQIYFDFSGYSDMAIGLGRMFGFSFPENFNYPYMADSVQDFWRRWHISLSSWFRDYLYIPLGGNRCRPARVYINLVVVFFLCGLWHGARWNFVVWGLFHGLFLIIERMGFGAFLTRLPGPCRHLYTLLVVWIGWVFFRAEAIAYAGQYIAALFGLSHHAGGSRLIYDYLSLEFYLMLALSFLFSTSIYRRVTQRVKNDMPPNSLTYACVNIGLIVSLFFLSSTYIAGSTYNPFIYFRF